MAKLKDYYVSVMIERLWIEVPIKAASLDEALTVGRGLKLDDVVDVGEGDVVDYEQRVRGVSEG